MQIKLWTIRVIRLGLISVFVSSLLNISTLAGNCLIQGNQQIGDCSNVTVGPAKDLVISKDDVISGNYRHVTIQNGVSAILSGDVKSVTVAYGGRLDFSGNARNFDVWGSADIDGNAGWITVRQGGVVVIRGIVEGVSGKGKITKASGAIIGGKLVY